MTTSRALRSLPSASLEPHSVQHTITIHPQYKLDPCLPPYGQTVLVAIEPPKKGDGYVDDMAFYYPTYLLKAASYVLPIK